MHSKCINSTSGCKSVTAKVYSATPISYKKRTFRLYTTYHKGGVYYAAQLSEVPGISGQLLQLLQSKFNAAASLVFSARKSEHITPLLRELYWSRVPERIHFRLRVLAYHRLNGITPSYLAETLHLTADLSPRRLLGASTSMLVIPTTRPVFLTLTLDYITIHTILPKRLTV